jgi:uncharacterized protein with ParB-like and HNH nuclease domain
MFVLHWGPKSGQPEFPELLDFTKSPTIRFLNSAFPDIKQYLISDLWTRLEAMNNVVGGKRIRRQPPEIYGNDPRYPLHQHFNKELILQSSAKSIVVWGKNAGDFVRKAFKLSEEENQFTSANGVVVRPPSLPNAPVTLTYTESYRRHFPSFHIQSSF